jgi:iron complex outermembrane recepter protein
MRTSKRLGIVLAASTALVMPAVASAQSSTPEASDEAREILVTGSRIKRDPNNSALPLTIISNVELTREGINSPEQLISFLSSNGNGADNLAANSDVTSGAQRGTNGLSAANLRGQVRPRHLCCSTVVVSRRMG